MQPECGPAWWAERFSRQILLPEVGLEGQRRLHAARILVVGAGGLAAPLVGYLAAAGIGQLDLMDADCVEPSNLPRQTWFAPTDCGQLKVEVLAREVQLRAPDVILRARPQRFTPENAVAALSDVDVVLDASDNFATRFLLNDACRLARVPWVHAGVTRFSGIVTTFLPEGPCYRCFFPQPPERGRLPGCAESGVLGPAVGIVGAWQALEALKLCLGHFAATLAGRVLTLDLWHATQASVTLNADPNCPLCGDLPEILAVDPREVSYEATRQT
ncbi:MAG: HesA/MoeB/ThiF family protein [Candidatus Sericytochromatia bacterium]|nr:HesA/MoeB/ThiF family protein [Candidatus Sericytochromatia bacterium]